MTQNVERSDRRGGAGRDRGIEALRRSSEFRGPAEPLDDHDHANDHLALIYENREEQFANAFPFIRQGLEQGERCLYVADENSREDVLEAMRADGIDVDAALDTGALSVRTPAETYRRTGEFDRDAMLSFWEDSLEAATDENDFTGLRATAEMTWALDGGADHDLLMEYEAVLNSLYEGEEYVVLCQYNRDRFPAEVVRDVLETHPHLVVDNTVSRNFYYTPPEKFFGSEDPEAKVDRMVQTVRERTEAKADLEGHKEYLQELYQTTADNDLSFEETVERLLELGCERFGLRGGALAHLLSLDSNFRAEVTVGPDLGNVEGILPIQPAEGSFCRQAITWDEPTAVPDVVEAGWDDDAVYEQFGLASYFGIRVTAGADPYGTLWFYDTSPRDEAFTDDEHTFLKLMGQWVSAALERRQREQFLQQSYEITSDPDHSFEEKIERLLEHGRRWFGFDIGYFSIVDADANTFEIAEAVGEHPRIESGVTGTLSASYCRKVIEADQPVSVSDATAEGWENDPAYDMYGLDAFLGTTLEVDGELYGTLCFGDETPRDVSFSDTEYTFIELMSQWVSNELLHKARESELQQSKEQFERDLEETVDRLQQSNDRLKQFAYAASHDLQEPLRMVSSYLQLLENRYADELDEDGREYIDFAVGGADRMRAMVDDLLSYSRVEQSDSEFGPVEVDAVLERVTDDLRVQIEENDAAITTGSLPTVTADHEQLEQLFSNLVSNAIKYSGEGSPTVEITADRRPGRWEFEVADDGIGIDPEKTDRIFEVFKRLHHDDEYPGTGIGLSLCQEIVENHGGDIWVESEPGAGSTFRFTLPESGRKR